MISENTFKGSATYTPTVNEKGTIIDLKIESNTVFKANDKFTLMIIDNSGSMSGTKLETCKAAIKDLITRLFEINDKPQLELIVFNSYPTLHNLRGKTMAQCISTVNKVYSTGGTAFIPVFEMMENLFK